MTEMRHGTYGGYQAEKRAGLEACDACREAYNSYMAEYRRTNPASREKNLAYTRARNRAIRELISRHRSEYMRIYNDLREAQDDHTD